jgi:hypothetical protein
MGFGKLVKVKIGEIILPKRIKWNERQKKMTKEIIRNYNTNIGEIIISKDYKIIDGNHRFNILWKEYGEEHEITVRQISLTRLSYYIILLMFSPILVPMGVLVWILTKKRNLI